MVSSIQVSEKPSGTIGESLTKKLCVFFFGASEITSERKLLFEFFFIQVTSRVVLALHILLSLIQMICFSDLAVDLQHFAAMPPRRSTRTPTKKVESLLDKRGQGHAVEYLVK
jgi:hypothetical protein